MAAMGNNNLKPKRTPGRPPRNPLRACHLCSKSFNKSEHLLRHIRSHTNERPYTCQLCGKSFSRSDSLKRHEKSHRGCKLPRISDPGPTVPDASEQPTSGASDQQSIPTYTAQSPFDELLTTTPATSVHSQALDGSPQSRILSPNGVHSLQTAQIRLRPSCLDPIFDRPADVNQSTAGSQHVESADASASYPGLWDAQLDDSWVLASDFDIGALDSALNTTIAEWALPSNADDFLTRYQPLLSISQQTSRVQYEAPGGATDANNARVQADQPATRPSIRPMDWFSETRPDGEHARWGQRHSEQQQGETGGDLRNRLPSERPGEALYVDEQYRDSLTSKLRPRQYDNSHLSVDHLNQCLRLYLKKFHPIFPAVHVPTFRPNSRNALLFLSMCSIGSLFIGSPEGFAKGHGIFARLHKAILASWEHHLSGTKMEALSMVQAALLGQTFGMLSRCSNDIVMTDAFQGTLVAWTRKVQVFGEDSNPYRVQEGMDKRAIQHAWREWSCREQARRIALALSIHDMKMANLHHHSPWLRHLAMSYTNTPAEALFEAPTAESWYTLALGNLASCGELYQSQPTTLKRWIKSADILSVDQTDSLSRSIRASSFCGYSILASLNACISEARHTAELDDAARADLTHGLIRWHELYWTEQGKASFTESFDLEILWHWCFILLYSEPSLLEKALGKDGTASSAHGARGKLQSWALNSTSEYERCLFHASMLLDQVEAMRVSATPAIHVPGALYCASSAWVVHGFLLRHDIAVKEAQRDEMLDWIELKVLGAQQAEAAWSSFRDRLVQHPSDMAYGFGDLLRKLNVWGISESFAEVIAEATRDSWI